MSHGGNRPGAGRPPVRNVSKVTLSLRVTPDVKAYLASEGNISEAVEEQTRKSAGFKQWRKSQTADQ